MINSKWRRLPNNNQTHMVDNKWLLF